MERSNYHSPCSIQFIVLARVPTEEFDNTVTKIATELWTWTFIKDGENRGLHTAGGSPTARENVGVMHLLTCGVNVMRSGKERSSTFQEP